jgi:hypothetical protein
MLDGISAETSIGTYRLLDAYDPDCLENNVRLFDNCLSEYAQVYKAAGIAIRHFPTVDVFVADYLA